jgi:hypothetical protein
MQAEESISPGEQLQKMNINIVVNCYSVTAFGLCFFRTFFEIFRMKANTYKPDKLIYLYPGKIMNNIKATNKPEQIAIVKYLLFSNIYFFSTSYPVLLKPFLLTKM